MDIYQIMLGFNNLLYKGYKFIVKWPATPESVKRHTIFQNSPSSNLRNWNFV